MERTAVLVVRLPSSSSSSIFPRSRRSFSRIFSVLRVAASILATSSPSPAGFLRSLPSFFCDLSSVYSRVSPRLPLASSSAADDDRRVGAMNFVLQLPECRNFGSIRHRVSLFSPAVVDFSTRLACARYDSPIS